MAYTDYSISQSYDPAEEERKKREQEIAAMSGLPVQAQAPIVPQAPEVPGTEFGQFAQQIQQPTPVNPQDLTNIQQMTQVPGTQVAGPMQQQDTNQYANYPDQTPNETQRLQAQAQAPLGQGQVNRSITATPEAQAALAQQTPSFDQALIQSQGDQKKMWEIYNNSQYTPEQRQVAGVQLSDMMKQDYQKAQATQFIRNATPEDLNKMLASRSSEGSWGKAIMYGLLGMEASAKDEAAKLGVGAKWQSQTVMNKDGTTSNILYKMRADGLPMEGYNAETGKQLGSKELAGLVAGGQKLDLVGGTYVNDKTKEVGRVVTDKNTGQSWIQTDQGRKPMAGFRPQSSMGTMDDMRARKVQEINLSLQGKTAEEKMRILRDYNSALVSQGIAPVSPTEIGLAAPQISGGTTTPAPAATATTPAATTPTVAKPATTNAATTPAPAASGAMADRTTVAPKPSPFSTVGQTGMGSGPGGRPTGPELDAKKKALMEEAELVGQDIGKFKINQGKAESNADYLLTKVDELIAHPGFETSVGAKGPTMGFGAFKTPISGTDAADFAARFEEIQGQSFLQAIENLRGMGALSNVEGETATKAIKRMGTTQSEAEFKAASRDFQDIIKRGVDRARVKLGQEIKYGTPEASEKKKKTEGEWRVLNVQPGR